LAAKRLGLARVGLVGSIGPDFEARFRTAMAGYGVDVLNAKPAHATGGFRLVYDVKGNRTLDVLGVASHLDVEDLPPACFEAKTLLIAPILQEVGLPLMKRLRAETDAPIFLDPQGLIREMDDEGRIRSVCDTDTAATLTSLVDVIKPNEHEARVLTGVESPYTAVRVLTEWGARISIVTLAERGSLVGKGHNFMRIPPYTTTDIDPTGAGDTYIGAFITKYLEGKSIFECGVFASAAASIKVEHSGPDFPLTYAEASRRMHQLIG
jgi:sugar/nucleoside kinase (ribokinase family)